MACFEGRSNSAISSVSAVVASVGKNEGKKGITGTRCPVQSPFTIPTMPPAATAANKTSGQDTP